MGATLTVTAGETSVCVCGEQGDRSGERVVIEEGVANMMREGTGTQTWHWAPSPIEPDKHWESVDIPAASCVLGVRWTARGVPHDVCVLSSPRVCV